jgi:amidase
MRCRRAASRSLIDVSRSAIGFAAARRQGLDKGAPCILERARLRRCIARLLSAATNPDSALTHRDWLQLDEERTRLRLAWREFFREWDIVLCPIAACVAFEHLHGAYRGRKLRIDGVELPYFQQLFWAGLATCSYLPATVFPTGLGTEKLPIGLQAIGDSYADLQTIEFARLVSAEFGGFQPPSGID